MTNNTDNFRLSCSEDALEMDSNTQLETIPQINVNFKRDLMAITDETTTEDTMTDTSDEDGAAAGNEELDDEYDLGIFYRMRWRDLECMYAIKCQEYEDLLQAVREQVDPKFEWVDRYGLPRSAELIQDDADTEMDPEPEEIDVNITDIDETEPNSCCPKLKKLFNRIKKLFTHA